MERTHSQNTTKSKWGYFADAYGTNAWQSIRGKTFNYFAPKERFDVYSNKLDCGGNEGNAMQIIKMTRRPNQSAPWAARSVLTMALKQNSAACHLHSQHV
jgi:hypothetical protein